MGKQIFNEKGSYIPKTLRPTFGKLFQFEIEFPKVTALHIQVSIYTHSEETYPVVAWWLCVCLIV